MPDHPVRFFADEAAARHVGERLFARTLLRPERTHEAHLASRRVRLAVALLLLRTSILDRSAARAR